MNGFAGAVSSIEVAIGCLDHPVTRAEVDVFEELSTCFKIPEFCNTIGAVGDQHIVVCPLDDTDYFGLMTFKGFNYPARGNVPYLHGAVCASTEAVFAVSTEDGGVYGSFMTSEIFLH